ncbi:unnamed protein product [Lathyrus oleraceus]
MTLPLFLLNECLDYYVGARW